VIEESANSVTDKGGMVMRFPVSPSIITVWGLNALGDLVERISQVNPKYDSEAMLFSTRMHISQWKQKLFKILFMRFFFFC